MPLIIAIETATRLCSVALGRDGAPLAVREGSSERYVHAEKVNVFIAEVLEEAGLTLGDIDAIAVGTGPGSYTGLRIGLSAAKGLCYALDVPIIGLSTLGTLVAAARQRRPGEQGTWWPMVDARRMEVFAQPHAADGSHMEEASPLILDAAWAAVESPRLVFGDGADKAVGLWAGQEHIVHVPGVVPSAAAMFTAAEARFAAGAFDDLAYLTPEYGKAANVGQPKR